MRLVRISLVFLALVGATCPAKMIIETSKPKGWAELEEAAIKILTDCYANRDKTIVVAGSFPGSFVEKLSSRRAFSLVMLDDRKRPTNNTDYMQGNNRDTLHKVHVLVMLAPNGERFSAVMRLLMGSRYYNTLASILMIGWSPEMMYNVCNMARRITFLFEDLYVNEILNANLLCHHHKMGRVLYGFDPFSANRPPKPWRIVGRKTNPYKSVHTYLMQKYSDRDNICENLNFEKTRNLGGVEIKIIRFCWAGHCSYEANKKLPRSRRALIGEAKSFSYIPDFLAYVNATGVDVFVARDVVGVAPVSRHVFIAVPWMLRLASESSFAYPHQTACAHLITKFRGNKSQLGKIYSVIDDYSWIGVAVVSFVTLLFFKYVLRQSLMDGILNVVRLSCNFGLSTIPSNTPPRIYMTTILFFVVTMQGIFGGNLAALLTHDTPVRQVNSVLDLVDLGYTVYAPEEYFIVFKDVLPEDRVISSDDEHCFEYAINHSSVACLDRNDRARDIALDYDLHLSDCVQMEYTVNRIPQHWAFEEVLNKFLGICIGGGIMMPLHYIVDEKRYLELASQLHDPEPRVMTLNHLLFAFVILGIGLTCASVTFVIEITVHRYQRRVRKTRVIFLN